MGGELKQILEKQRQLEEQFEQITTPDQLKEQAYSLNAAAQGLILILILSPPLTLLVHVVGMGAGSPAYQVHCYRALLLPI
jgi:hypothetical protein